jgi:hypothetical protein
MNTLNTLCLKKTLDPISSRINCYDGGTYSPANFRITFNQGEKEISYSNDRDIRSMCKDLRTDTLDYGVPKNYSFTPAYSPMPSWGYGIDTIIIKWVLPLLGSLALAIGIFRLIQIIFFYIIIGESPNSNHHHEE